MNRILPLVIFLICVIHPLPGQADAKEYMELGWTAFNRSDIVDAMRWFRKAAELGHTPAIVQLGKMLDYSEQNQAAARWFTKAAEQGDAEAQYELGLLYVAGEGVDRNNQQGVAWIRKAAEQNYPQAIRYLAEAYERGGLDMAVDYNEVLVWLRHGVAQNDPWAIKRLSQAYREGQLGLPVNPDAAAELDQKLEGAE